MAEPVERAEITGSGNIVVQAVGTEISVTVGPSLPYQRTRKVVMISSTAQDLLDHCGEIREGCERAGFEPHMVQRLPAPDADAIAASLRMISEADVYIGVFAFRYGHVPKGHDISITEMEYNRAVEMKKLRLIFFMHDDHLVTRKDIEGGPGEAKLQKLKDRIASDHVVTFFRSPKDLRAQIVEALSTIAKELDAAASKGDGAASAIAGLHRKTSIPSLPEPYIAHPYGLLHSRNLVGRQAELNALTDWVSNPASAAFDARVFCFVAIGGMGKSALTWKWFNDIAPNEMKPLAGRVWWSFYESDADFENFLIRVLCYFGGQSEQAVRALPWPEREARILRHLNEDPYLLVLDGLERILIAYRRMDASYLADDDFDRQTANYVVGAAGPQTSAAQSYVGQHRMRQTADPRAEAFLQKLAGVAKSHILITSRLYPTALQMQTGHMRPGCFAYFLRGLNDDDALGLWRTLNIKGSRAELMPIFHSVEGHPLLVQVLASLVANYRKAPGDFAQWRTDHPQFDPTALPLVQSRTHILAFALEGVSAKGHEALHTLVSFRMPASYATLEAVLVGPDKACGSAQDLDRTLTELEDRGLIGWDREANRYDAHPIVRGVVWQLAGGQKQHAIYAAIEAHFRSMPTPDWEEVETLADLTPAIERFHTLVGLDRHNDAWNIFRDQLEVPTFYSLAAHLDRITWLERLLPELNDNETQAYALHALATSHYFSGRPNQAASYGRLSREVGGPRWQNSSLSLYLVDTGALREAIDIACRTLIFLREDSYWKGNALSLRGDDAPGYSTLRRSHYSPSKFGSPENDGSFLFLEKAYWEGFCLQHLGKALGLTGDHARCHLVLRRSQCVFSRIGLPENESETSSLLAERSLRLGDVGGAAIWASRASALAAIRPTRAGTSISALTQGQAAMGLLDFARAEDSLHNALTRSRSVSDVGLEIRARIAIAELQLKRGNLASAREHLNEAFGAAEFGSYYLCQSDVHNLRVQIALEEGDKRAAIDAATKAYRAAWCDGPPYAYHWGLIKAKAHLAALGAPEPEMPPLDESKFEPMPEVEVNPKDEYWVDLTSLN